MTDEAVIERLVAVMAEETCKGGQTVGQLAVALLPEVNALRREAAAEELEKASKGPEWNWDDRLRKRAAALRAGKAEVSV